jgi:hypothetical protein
MKRGDLYWGLAFAPMLLVFLIPTTRDVIISLAEAHPYLMGFVKFAILATMGDFLGSRVATGDYVVAKGLPFHVLVWGIIGVMVTLVFPTYMGGASAAQASGLLPFAGVALGQAFFGSMIMNLTFAPVMNTFHRVSDTYINLKFDKTYTEKITFSMLIESINWPRFVIFNWLKYSCHRSRILFDFFRRYSILRCQKKIEPIQLTH